MQVRISKPVSNHVRILIVPSRSQAAPPVSLRNVHVDDVVEVAQPYIDAFSPKARAPEGA